MDPVVANAKAIIEQGSKSFAAAAKLFDTETREKAFMLYAWCRYCDDQIDGQDLGFGMQSPEPEEQSRILERLIAQTESAMAGDPTEDPVFAAFQRVFQISGMDRRYPLELLEGFAMDVARREYLTLDDTLLYCYHVAGVVGAMMATIMGVQDQPTLNRAIDLGIAFQLTNISRDVMEDAADSRIYLPREWLAEAGAPIEPADFPGQEETIFPVVDRLLGEADRYYDSAVHGIARLPFRCAWAIAAARKVYGAIGEQVRRQGAQAWDARAGTSSLQKLGMLAGSFFTAARVSLSHADAGPPRTDLWTAPPTG
ncbi:MAG: phytoene/squalene synthase family protein [Gammaproteobacteria bacterium]|nr:MAG: phytoene/squalene synthase family protein [Gammaproteobacteria bacterium]